MKERYVLRLIPVEKPNESIENVSIAQIKKLLKVFEESKIISFSNIKMRITKSMPKYVSPISYILEGIESKKLDAILDKVTHEDRFALIFQPSKNASHLFSELFSEEISIEEIAIDGYGDVCPSGFFKYNVAVIFDGKINKKTCLNRLKNDKMYGKISNEIAKAFDAKGIETYLEAL